jgi:hypothetical protein
VAQVRERRVLPPRRALPPPCRADRRHRHCLGLRAPSLGLTLTLLLQRQSFRRPGRPAHWP